MKKFLICLVLTCVWVATLLFIGRPHTYTADFKTTVLPGQKFSTEGTLWLESSTTDYLAIKSEDGSQILVSKSGDISQDKSMDEFYIFQKVSIANGNWVVVRANNALLHFTGDGEVTVGPQESSLIVFTILYVCVLLIVILCIPLSGSVPLLSQ